MPADTTTLQGLCGKRKTPEDEGSSMDPPSKFPKLNYDSVLTSLFEPYSEELEFLSDDIFFGECSANSALTNPFQEDTNQFSAQSFREPKTTYCDVPSSPFNWDSIISSEDSNDCYDSNYDSSSSISFDNINASINNDWISQSVVNSTPYVPLPSDVNCVTNKDLDLDSTSDIITQIALEISNGLDVINNDDRLDMNSNQSEMVDDSDDKTVAKINCFCRNVNHAPFNVPDELKKHNSTETSFAFVQPKIWKLREFQVVVLEKSCTDIILSLSGLPEYFGLRTNSYSRDNQSSLHFKRNDFGEGGIVKFYLQGEKQSYTNVEKRACALELLFIFDNSDPIIVTLDDLYVCNHKYESSSKVERERKRPTASTVVITKNEVKIVTIH